MTTNARVNAARMRRRALWLFLFVGVVLHWSMCPPGAHAGVFGATRACVSAAPGASAQSVAALPGSGRAVAAGRPCAPAPRPHHHSPCLDVNHRGFSHERSAWPCPAGALARCPLPAERPTRPEMTGRDRSSLPASPRSGAGLLIDLCSSRT